MAESSEKPSTFLLRHPLAKRDNFTARVLSAVGRIPRGQVATYGEIARRAGRPGAARAVGNIMRNCHRGDIPCHRVVAAGGRVGGYGGGELVKRALLIAEGIPFAGARIRMDRVRRRPGPARDRR